VAPEDDPVESTEVPATVVCARCGRPDCPGCARTEETTLPSGVIEIVPWERPGASLWFRLWATARGATRSAPTFFATLSAGSVGAPLRFALLCEVLAVGSVGLVLAAVLAAVAPDLALRIAFDPPLRWAAVRLAVLSVASFAALLVVAHLGHGLALDLAARRHGARPHRSQAMRFGLYGAGWDLLSSSPIGLGVTLLGEGPSAALRLLPLSITVPTIAAEAFLRRTYHLEEPSLSAARRLAGWVAVAASVLAACGLVAGLVAVMMALVTAAP
jgi:hypothetical protein